MKLKKFSAAALAALTVTMMSAAPVLAADDIEVNEDISVSGDYDWKRFANDHITLNVYNNGLYISDGSDESINVLSAFEAGSRRENNTIQQKKRIAFRGA